MKSDKTALIFGISGQDGACLARLLLDKGCRVHGASRDCDVNRFERLERLGLRAKGGLSSATRWAGGRRRGCPRWSGAWPRPRAPRRTLRDMLARNRLVTVGSE